MLRYKQLEESDLPQVEIFCQNCRELNLKNNSSFEALKIHEIKPPYGQYWLIIDDDTEKVVGISGCHHLPEVSEVAFRILYRSCLLPSYRMFQGQGLFKKITEHEPLFKNLVPLQVAWARQHGAREIFITTNSNRDENWKEKMLQMDRILRVMEKQKVVSLYRSDMELYNCRQNIWRLQDENFLPPAYEDINT